MQERSWRALLVSSLSMVGCQSPPDLTPDLNAYVSQRNDADLRLCDCPQDLGFGTVSECSDATVLLTQLDADCLAMALDGHEREGQEYLDCSNAALGEYIECLAANVSCEPGVNSGCTSTYTNTVASCGTLPSDVQSAFNACLD